MPLASSDAAIGSRNRNVVRAHISARHVAIGVELPVLVAVSAVPLAGSRVLPLVFEANGDSVTGECPKLLDQAVVELDRPLAIEERTDRFSAGEELVAIAPALAFGVRLGH